MQDDRTTFSRPTSFPVQPPSSSRLAVIGTGAVGSEVCRLLMESGHRHILLVDPDVIEPRNLALSPLLRRGGVHALGRPKVELIRSLAQEQGLPWQAIQAEIADVGYTRLLQCDALLSCTDSALARVEATLVARSLRLLLLDAAVKSHQIPEGRVTCFSPASGAACYLCGLPEQRRAELLTYAWSSTLGCAPAWQPELSPMTGAPAAVQSAARNLLALVGNCLHHAPESSFAYRLTPTETPIEHQIGTQIGHQTDSLPGLTRSERVELTPSPNCPWHSLPSPDELQSLPFNQPLFALLPPGVSVDLPWPLCLRARCLGCMRTFAPCRRTAFVRRRLHCPFCGRIGLLEPLESIHSIAADSASAPQTLQQLGLPAGHRYLTRSAILPLDPNPHRRSPEPDRAPPHPLPRPPLP